MNEIHPVGINYQDAHVLLRFDEIEVAFLDFDEIFAFDVEFIIAATAVDISQ